jgi:hypothetical protein
MSPICHGEPKIREESFASRKFGLPMWRLRSGLKGAGAALSSSRDQSAAFHGESRSNSLK